MNHKNIFIVAEIGCNHNGNINIAKKMIDIAAQCGVDAVKFQTFKANRLISKKAPKAEYQKKTTGESDSQLEMTTKLELSHSDFRKLSNYACSLNLKVFSTPFDIESINFLIEEKQKIWKIPSGEITNLPFLEKIASIDIDGKEVFLSTGMASIDEIRFAVNILEAGNFSKENITILHCNTEYPTPYNDVNLLAIQNIQEEFPGYKVGFSDHSSGYYAALAAIPLGITFIEKHFTLDKDMVGPDHKASINPEELKLLCEGIRIVEIALGDKEKKVTDSERKNKIIARKSIIANRTIKKGETFTTENLTTKRPGSGISPIYWHKIQGMVAEQDFFEDDLIIDSHFDNQI